MTQVGKTFLFDDFGLCLRHNLASISELINQLFIKRPLEKPRRRWEDNIKKELQEVRKGMAWIDVAQGRDRWRALVKAVMNLRVP
jgi:hypothetical protein